MLTSLDIKLIVGPLIQEVLEKDIQGYVCG